MKNRSMGPNKAETVSYREPDQLVLGKRNAAEYVSRPTYESCPDCEGREEWTGHESWCPKVLAGVCEAKPMDTR
jgi:hypothetical protein